jgi:hypothetical protein
VAALRHWRDSVERPFLSIALGELGSAVPILGWAKTTPVADVSLRPPPFPLSRLFAGPETLTPFGVDLCDRYAECAAVLTGHGTSVSIENLRNRSPHASPPVASDPRSLVAFLEGIRRAMPKRGCDGSRTALLSVLLDIGGTRDNPPQSGITAPSEWTSLLGDLLRHARVHQVSRSHGTLVGHREITSPYGPLINHAGILLLLGAAPPPPPLSAPTCVFVDSATTEGSMRGLHVLKRWGDGAGLLVD